MASPFRCDNMASRGISRFPSLARVYCTFALAADDETRRQFPFDFVLKVTSIVNEAVLRPRAIVLNKSMGDADFVRLSPSLSLAPALQGIATGP